MSRYSLFVPLRKDIAFLEPVGGSLSSGLENSQPLLNQLLLLSHPLKYMIREQHSLHTQHKLTTKISQGPGIQWINKRSRL